MIFIIYYFWQANRTASVLLWPYLLWALFATYLNSSFYLLNRT
ncbi:MAG: tryptophan-rich sensory protein [Candidatus Riflebacteria bacterium]|nr:tryptophan-rich sensory protein [Candidatus Riflebacteria bacterium]